jgi:hypothetical protein
MLLPWIVLLVVALAAVTGFVVQLKRRVSDKIDEHKAERADRDDPEVTGRR